MKQQTCKCVVVGDGACGKTSILTRFVKDEYLPEYIPTVFDNYVKDVTVEDKTVSLTLWDTAGQEDYDRLRPLSYPDTHVILLCFAIDSPESFDNIPAKWLPELAHYIPNAGIVLLATKTDLRDGNKISKKDGLALANSINAIAYIETSALSGLGVTEAFLEAAKYFLHAKTKKSAKCSIV